MSKSQKKLQWHKIRNSQTFTKIYVAQVPGGMVMQNAGFGAICYVPLENAAAFDVFVEEHS